MKIEYVNYNKEFPKAKCWKKWFSLKRYWSGKIWHIGIKHHCLVFDFRYDWISDMTDGRVKSK